MNTQNEQIQYIVDMSNFKGSIESTVRNGRVDYSGYLYGNKEQDMTVEEYKSLPKMQGKKLEVMDDKRLDEVLTEYYKSICGDWKELTEEQYWDALECLPPMQWHDINKRYNVFFCMEAQTSHIHSMYVHDREAKRYFTCLFSRFSSDATILESIQKINL